MPFKRPDFPNDLNCKPNIENYDKMVELAEKLAKPFPFVRVDLYEDVNKKILFGELTFTPTHGTMNFQPEEWNYKLGEYLILPKMDNLK